MAPHRASVSQPHSVSLKVLRLSRPSLAHSAPLPQTHASLHTASLAYPGQAGDAFPLTPLLTLPPTFGAAYVGEPFSCTLCANNERHAEDSTVVRDVHITAELQSPSAQGEHGGAELVLAGKDPDDAVLRPGQTLQRLVRHELADEGGHVLAVAVAYTEVSAAGEEKHRSFRKLYQFVARQAVGVRTKIGQLGKGRWAIEAQVENLAQGAVVLDAVGLEPGDGVKWLGFNGGRTVLGEGDMQQLAFVVEADGEVKVDRGKFVLARMRVDWRMAMGQEGMLKTGWLGAVKKD